MRLVGEARAANGKSMDTPNAPWLSSQLPSFAVLCGCVIALVATVGGLLLESQLRTFSILLLAVAVLFVLAGLGAKSVKVKMPGVEISFEALRSGLSVIPPSDSLEQDGGPSHARDMPELLGIAYDDTMVTADDGHLNELRSHFLVANDGWFLAHLLAPRPGGEPGYRVAIFVVGHKKNVTRAAVIGARMFFGREWNSQAFDASWSVNGLLGVTTEAPNPFLVVAEVELGSEAVR